LVRAAVVFVVAIAVLVMLEHKLIYFPMRELEIAPPDLGMPFEDVRLIAEDGVRLHAWFLPRPESRYTVLVSHGNAGNISHRLDRARLLQEALRADVLLYDYRGYGRSEGAPDEEGTYRDARAAYRHLVELRGVPAERLILFGESLGSAVTVDLALAHPCRAVVLESPFTSIRDMARSALPWLPLGGLVRTKYDTLAKIGRLRAPVLVMHGDRDSVVPFAQGERVFAAASEPKRFYRIAGADHNDTYVTGGDAYWRALASFIEGIGERQSPKPGA
jgi:fermentation-respiration switch protein FrsA (DUF1100 family)